MRTMRRSTPFFIGFRYLLSRKGNRFISFTTLMSMAGITLGVFVLIVVLSVYNGSQGLQRDRTLITVPHAEIKANADFNDWPAAIALINEHQSVEALAPYLLTEAMFSDQGNHQTAAVKGIDPDLEKQVSPLSDHILLGSLDSLHPGSRQVLLGRVLANALRVNPGDSVNLLLPVVNSSSQGFDLESHRFNVSGIFDVRFSVGSNLAYINIEDAADIMGLDSPDQALHLRLKTTDLNRADSILAEIMLQLSEAFPTSQFSGTDWSRSEASLFTALRMEKLMTGFMLLMIVAIGAFNIVATLVMVVSDKQADIAILRTMGAGKRSVLGVFLVQGSLIGIVGTLIGALAGVMLVLNYQPVANWLGNLLNPNGMYMIASLPAELHQSDLVFICVLSLFISFSATLYPAWRASGIEPAEVLRYE